MKILYIEDTENAFRWVELLVSRAGHEILGASTATEGRRLAHDHATDLALILSDIELPDYSGLILIQQLRQELPELPIIATSSLPRSLGEKDALDAGCVMYIPKPISSSSNFIELLEQSARRTNI
jgi:DNA-binding response OmpR family regulator